MNVCVVSTRQCVSDECVCVWSVPVSACLMNVCVVSACLMTVCVCVWSVPVSACLMTVCVWSVPVAGVGHCDN